MRQVALTIALLIFGFPTISLGETSFTARLISMEADTSALRIEQVGDKVVAAVGFETKPFEGTPQQVASRFLHALGIENETGKVEMHLLQTHSTTGHHVVRFQQKLLGIDIEGKTTTVQMDTAGRVRSVHGIPNTVHPESMDIHISEKQAIAKAVQSVGGDDGVQVGVGKLVILAQGRLAVLAHRIPIRKALFGDTLFVYINATDGTVLWKRNPITH